MGEPDLGAIIDLERHPLADPGYRAKCRRRLDADGAVLLRSFITPGCADRLVAEAEQTRHLAFHSSQTHNVYLDPPDPDLPRDDARSRAITSTKGAVTADQIPSASPLRSVYESALFRNFLCAVLGETALHEYADRLSSINVNFFEPGQELGWHFDNSEFAVTLLLRAPEAGGVYEYIADMRDDFTGDQNEAGVAAVLDSRSVRPIRQLDQRAGDLALFRGRNALHRVSPVEGSTSRILVVLAYNTEPGMSLSEHARLTFFGRLE